MIPQSKNTIASAVGLLCLIATTAAATEGVSPGAVDHVAQVNNACPTFSWQESADAALYELVAYELPSEGDTAGVELTAEREALYARVPGGALAWTPSADRCFAPGGRYVWFLRSVSGLAVDQGIEAGEWSAGRYFEVPGGPSAEELARAVEVIRRWEATAGSGASFISSGTGTGTDTETDADRDKATNDRTGTGNSKSVQTASAAIRGDNPELDIEAYGVVGTSASVFGAGVAAANREGGPDLVLDGSFDGGADTRMSEWGIDRSDPADQTFWVRNSGGGAVTLDVLGTLRGTALECPGCIGPNDLASESVSTDAIEDGSIAEVDIGLGAVNTTHIFDGSIQVADLAFDSVASSTIIDGTVREVDLADEAVSGSKIQNSAIHTAKLHDGSVTAEKIAGGAVGAAQIAFESIGEAELADEAVTHSKIAPSVIDTGHLMNGAVNGAQIADGAISATKIADGAVNGNKLRTNAVTSAHIADGAVTMADLAADSVGSAQIEYGGVGADDIDQGAVSNDHLAAGSVTTLKIANGAVTATKLAAGVIGSASIADGAVTTAKLADEAVTTAKLANGAVNTNQLASGAVNSVQIHDLAVVYGKIASEAVTSAAIADGTITKFDIAGGAIETGHIANGNVTSDDLASAAVTASKLAPGAVTSAAIANGSITAADIDPDAALDADTLDGHHSSVFQPRLVSATATVSTPAFVDQTCSTYASVSVTTSGPGFVMFDAIAYVMLRQIYEISSRVYVVPSESPADCWALWGSHASFGVPSNAWSSDGDDYWGGTLTVPHTYQVTSSGQHTYYLNVATNQEFMLAQIDRAYLTAVFVPQ